jgi:hypothetical protein
MVPWWRAAIVGCGWMGAMPVVQRRHRVAAVFLLPYKHFLLVRFA